MNMSIQLYLRPCLTFKIPCGEPKLEIAVSSYCARSTLYKPTGVNFSVFKIFSNVMRFLFGYLPGVWVLKADVSEHFIGSIFIGNAYENGTDTVFRNVGY